MQVGGRAALPRRTRLLSIMAALAAALLVGLAAPVMLSPQRGQGASGGVVVLTGTSFPAGLGLGIAADPLGLQAALWAPLVGFDDHLQPYAVLATRVPTLANHDVTVVGGGMRVVVHLKPHLRFSDGSPLTANDVLFGLRLNLDPAIGNSFGLDEIASASAPDAHTVVLQFHDLYGAYLAYALPPALPEAYFIHKYHTSNIHTLAQDYVHDPYDSPVDVYSGPYKVEGVAPGQRLTLAPNPYFTALPPARARGATLPRPELRYVVLSADESALVRDLHARGTGIDVALGLSPATLPGLQGLSSVGLRVRTEPALAVEHLELNMATPALRDLRVRQALQDAIDKRALLREVFPASAHVTVATSLIPSSSPYHDASLAVSPYDPAAARRLLRAAGYTPALSGSGHQRTHPLALTLVTTNDPTRQREADLLVHDWAAVGVRVTPVFVSSSPADRGSLYAPYDRGGVLATRHFDLALFDLRLGPDPATVAALFDPDRIPTPLSQGASRRNYTGIDVDALAELPETAQASLNPASRKQGYARVQQEVNALLPYIVLYEPPQVVVDDGRVLNLRPAPQDAADLWNSWEWARRDGGRGAHPRVSARPSPP